jgi:hypothetical protein
MKKTAILAGVLALGLGACTQNGGVYLGQGFDMSTEIVGASVAVTTTPATATTAATAIAKVTQPTIVFHARPQSLGFKLQSYTVQVVDQAGAAYASQYKRQAGAIVLPGFVCSTAATTLSNCQANLKVAADVVTPVNGLVLIADDVAQQIAADCTSNRPTELRMNVSFYGVDDSGRDRKLAVDGINISTCALP